MHKRPRGISFRNSISFLIVTNSSKVARERKIARRVERIYNSIRTAEYDATLQRNETNWNAFRKLLHWRCNWVFAINKRSQRVAYNKRTTRRNQTETCVNRRGIGWDIATKIKTAINRIIIKCFYTGGNRYSTAGRTRRKLLQRPKREWETKEKKKKRHRLHSTIRRHVGRLSYTI